MLVLLDLDANQTLLYTTDRVSNDTITLSQNKSAANANAANREKSSAIAADSDNSNSPSVLKNQRVLKLWRFGAHEFYSIT